MPITTYQEAKVLIANHSPALILTESDGEYRVAYRVGAYHAKFGGLRKLNLTWIEQTAYYTTDLIDAIGVAANMQHEIEEA